MMDSLMYNGNWQFCLLLLFFVTLNYSCKKDDCNPPESDPYDWTYFGASAIINEEYWEANRATFTFARDGKISISLEHNVWYGNTLWAHRSSISVRNLEPELSEFTELRDISVGETGQPTALVHTSTADGDAATGSFRLHEVEGVQNWITISEFNKERGELGGTLGATFVKSGGLPVNNIFSDTVVVTNCMFRAKFIE